MLLQAMAKFVGSYANLSGGTEPFALMALTGPLVIELVLLRGGGGREGLAEETQLPGFREMLGLKCRGLRRTSRATFGSFLHVKLRF